MSILFFIILCYPLLFLIFLMISLVCKEPQKILVWFGGEDIQALYQVRRKNMPATIYVAGDEIAVEKATRLCRGVKPVELCEEKIFDDIIVV